MPNSLKKILELDSILSAFKVPIGKSGKVTDLFKVAVLETFGDTHLPYLYDVLGKDKFLLVLDIFQDTEMIPCPHCGLFVEWPSRDKLAKILRELIIYFRVSKTEVGKKAQEVRDLATEFDISEYMVRSAYKRMSEKAEWYRV